MILEHGQWCFGYDQILKDCRPNEDDASSSKSVLLLCNADVDALSSARILSYMLRSDGIHYQLSPCHNYSDLKERLLQMKDQLEDEIRAVILLNFGAAYNLAALYQQQLLQEPTKLYVLDCKRPIHLANVYARSSVVVFLDSTQKLHEMPSDGDNLSGEDSSSDDDSDSDDDDSDSDDDSKDSASENSENDSDEEEARFDDVVGEKQKVQESDPSYDAEDEDDDDDKENSDENDNDENDPSIRESKRQKTDAVNEPSSSQQSAATISPRELHRLRRNRLRKYYQDGSFYGSPSSFVAYQLASQNRYGEQGDLLWLACVGVTDAYLHSRLDLIGYARLAKDLSGICAKLYPSSFLDRALNTVYAEDLITNNNNNNQSNQQTKIALSENGRIFSEKDFRFFLLRHSSLLDSMQYSEYVCTKLQLYTKQGEQRLLEMLARMGYPLDECKQPFCFMQPSLRRSLKEKLGTHAKVNTKIILNIIAMQFTRVSI